MEDKLFCDRVANGELSKNDVLKFAETVSDKVHLCWLLFCRMPSTRTAQAETECERLSMAMAWIQTKYGFEWGDGEYIYEQPSKPMDAVFFDEAKQEKPEQTNEVVLPDVLDIERARQIFGGAIIKGWMQPNGNNGYKWIGFGNRGITQQLVYMCGQIFGYKKGQSGNNGKAIPSKELEKLFDVYGFYSRLIKCWEADKPQKWRKSIDEMIEKVTKST